MWLLIFLVVFLLVFGFAYWTGSLTYTYHPEALSPSDWKDILIFLTTYLFLLLTAIVASWIASLVILSLTREKPDERVRMGVETRVDLSWAWGFLIGGFAMAFFITYVIFSFGVSASRWWEAFGIFLPHLLVIVTLLLFSLFKAKQA
jgi:hypothetical protein